MVCTGTKYCVIKSFHPESTSTNYFLVTQHNFLWNIIEGIVNTIYHKTHIQEWTKVENVTLPIIEENILGKVPGFKSLKPLCTYIYKIDKCVQQISFE